jgi:SsrA-binding protein
MQLVAPAVARHVLPHGPACALRPQAAGFLRVNPDRAKDVNPVALRDGAIGRDGLVPESELAALGKGSACCQSGLPHRCAAAAVHGPAQRLPRHRINKGYGNKHCGLLKNSSACCAFASGARDPKRHMQPSPWFPPLASAETGRSSIQLTITQKFLLENYKNMSDPVIRNKRALHDYFIEERFEAGLVLRGWEVKSVRAGRATITLAHVYVREGELFLCNASLTPADQICTHDKPELTRTRKLLMHKKEIMRLIGKVDRSGFALIPLEMHFVKGRVKLTLALARGKKQFEKRSDESKKEWKRDQARIMKNDMTRGKPRQNYKDI